jgi:hypothetical protein
MNDPITEERFLSKLVLIRLVLSGALVGVAIAELFGFSTGTHSQVVAGTIGAAAVGILKIAHFI